MTSPPPGPAPVAADHGTLSAAVRTAGGVALVARSPTVRSLGWGRTETDVGSFKDAKLWPGGGRQWDWTETGTSHRPGIQPADVAELVDHGARTVILTRGQLRRLQVMDATLQHLRDQDVAVEVLDSRAGVDRYNQLAADGQPVGALVHSTC